MGMIVSRKLMAEVHAAIQDATQRLCFTQQQMLKGVMSGDKLSTAHNPRDKLDTARMLPGTIWLYAVAESWQITVFDLKQISQAEHT